MTADTLFLRLAGPMQSWGTSSRLQLRRTDAYPSKSGILGLLLCAMGVARKDSEANLPALVSLSMGVRVDRPGTLAWDYHTAGGGRGDGPDGAIGIRSANGKIKKTGTTGAYETLLSRRQYLCDASFLVAIRGAPATIDACASALREPVWPVFLGRKSCVPAEPVLVGTDSSEGLTDALSSIPWRAPVAGMDGTDRVPRRTLDCFIEHPAGSPAPAGARLVHDVPQGFGYYNHGPRWVVPAQVTVPVGEPLYRPKLAEAWTNPYGPEWVNTWRPARLKFDNYLCVLCKSPAVEVHHVDYEDVRLETLRSVCKLCHDACTMLEYGQDMHRRRIDPSDPAQRPEILEQIDRLLAHRRFSRRRELLEQGRAFPINYFDHVPASWTSEGP
jgi:CRISPR system Cascade subunit CasD